MSEKQTERTDATYLKWKRETELTQQRWKQLYELEKEWGKEAIKYLMLLNSGGAVAALSFIGAVGPDYVWPQAKVALGFYLVGVILAGTMVAVAYLTVSSIFKGWQADYDLYYYEKITYKQLSARDDARVPSGKLDVVLGISSFACFILGSLVGGCGLF